MSGVDLFFVLSGFLITRILLKSKHDASYFKSFFVNRSVRILPLYFLLLFGLLVLKLLIETWPQKFGFISSLTKGDMWLIWFSTFLTNIKMCLTLSWGSPSHLWTLAVEQQFYLIWPVLVLIVPKRKFPLLCWSCIFLAIILRAGMGLMFGNTKPELTFFSCHTLTPLRMDCFAVGAIIAYRQLEGNTSFIGSRILRILIIAAGFLVVIANLAGLEINTMVWDGTYWVMPCVVYYSFFAIFYGIILESLSSGQWNNRFMNSGLLCLFGKYSYAMYLFHPFVRHGLLLLMPVKKIQNYVGNAIVASFIFLIISLLISLIVGHISWQYFERFWLKLKFHVPNQSNLAKLRN